MLSIIIPARTEKYLNDTIKDVLAKATGKIQIFPVLDGYGDYPYEPIIDKRVKYISLPPPYENERRKRHAINVAVSISKGKHICWLDAHCVVAPGFDEILTRDCKDNWVIVPSMYYMDLTKWDRMDTPPDDYRYWKWSALKAGRLAQWRWGARREERKDIMIDDVFCIQGSFVFMTRKWFKKCGFMQTKGYMGWGSEGEELCLKTLLNGGKVKVDKNTWYAHLMKNQMEKPMYKHVSAVPSYEYAYDYWVNKHKDFFVKLINENMPIPNYPENWEEILYG